MTRIYAPVVVASVVAGSATACVALLAACGSSLATIPRSEVTFPTEPMLALREDGATIAITNDRMARLTRDGRIVAAVPIAIAGTIEAVSLDKKGGAIVVGQHARADGATGDLPGCYVMSIGPTGRERWKKQDSSSHVQMCRALALDAKGDAYVASYEGVEPNLDILVRRYDGASGAVRWERRFGGKGGDIARAIAVARDGTILVGGNFSGEMRIGDTGLHSTGDHDAFLFALAPDGAPRWARSFGDVGFDLVESIVLDEDSAYLAGAWMRPQEFRAGEDPLHAGIMDGLIAKHSIADGALVWRRLLTRGDSSQVHDIALAKDGVVVIGHFKREVALGDRVLSGRDTYIAFAASLATDGGVQDAYVLAPSTKLGHQILVAPDGSHIVAGIATSAAAYVIWEQPPTRVP